MIGERLKEIRKVKKLRQEDLASAAGVKKSSISLYESGKNEPSDKIKVEISKLLNISIDYLLGTIDEPMPSYDEKTFMRLPDDLTAEEKIMLSEFIAYLRFRRDC